MGRRCCTWAISSGRSSKPVPNITPHGSRVPITLASAASSASRVKPWASPSTRACASAWASVSSSPNQSMTSGTQPARRADAASARPEAATITTVLLSIELAREREGVAKIEGDRFCGLDHLLEQAEFGLVLDAADCERTDPKRSAGEGVTIRVGGKSFDAGGRHRIHVGGDQQIFRGRDLRLGEYLYASAASGEDGLGFLEDTDLLCIVATISRIYVGAETHLDLHRRVGHALDPVVADQRHGGAFEGRDHGSREANHPGRAEHRCFQSLQVALLFILQRFLDTGNHRG